MQHLYQCILQQFLQVNNLEVYIKIKYFLAHDVSILHLLSFVLSHSAMSDSAIPWTVAHHTPLSMEFLQARILEWVAISPSRASSQPRD